MYLTRVSASTNQTLPEMSSSRFDGSENLPPSSRYVIMCTPMGIPALCGFLRLLEVLEARNDVFSTPERHTVILEVWNMNTHKAAAISAALPAHSDVMRVDEPYQDMLAYMLSLC